MWRSSRGSHPCLYFRLGVARGSAAEVQTQLILARRLQLAPPELLDRSDALTAEVHKMLNTLILNSEPIHRTNP